MQHKILKSEFSKNSLILIMGTVLAQLFPMAASLIISRIYTPDNIALWGLYISIVTILLSISSGTFDLSIMLPKSDEDAINLVSLSALLSFFFSLAVLLIVIIFNQQITTFFKNASISNWLYWVPFSVLILSVLNITTAWYNRKSQYTLIATNKVVKNWSMTAFQLSFGYSRFNYMGLIAGQIIGDFSASFFFLTKFIQKKYLSFLRLNFSLKSLKVLVKEYKKFPLYTLPTVLMNNLSSQILTIIVAIWFNLSLTGAYYFALRLLSAPMALIGSSVSQTYYQKLTAIVNDPGANPKPFIVKVWLILFAIAVLPLSVLFVFGEDLFVFVFGSEWKEAGRIASIMSPMILFTFISSPTSSGFVVFRKQNYNLIFGIFEFLFRPCSFYLGYYFKDFFLGLKVLVAIEILNVIAYNVLMWRSVPKIKQINN